MYDPADALIRLAGHIRSGRAKEFRVDVSLADPQGRSARRLHWCITAITEDDLMTGPEEIVIRIPFDSFGLMPEDLDEPEEC